MTSNTPGDSLIASPTGIGAAEDYLSSAAPIPGSGAEAADAAAVPEGSSIRDMPVANESGRTSGEKRKASDVTKDKDFGCALAVKIHEFTDKADISFEYSETKKKASVEAAKKRRDKRMEKSEGDDHWDCSMCGETFSDKYELTDHLSSKSHLWKKREKSESKTLGDLKIFRNFSRSLCPLTPRLTDPPQELRQASSFSEEKESELRVDDIEDVNSFDLKDLLFDGDQTNADVTHVGVALRGEEMSTAEDNWESAAIQKELSIPKDDKGLTLEEKVQDKDRNLLDENRELQRENTELKQKLNPEMSRKKLEDFLVGLKKKVIKGDLQDGQYEYEFENREYYRMMASLEECSSVEEREKKMVLCCLKIKRGKYDKEDK